MPPLSLETQSLYVPPCVSPPGAGCENIAAAQSRDTVPCLSVCRHLGQDAGILPPLSLETQSLVSLCLPLGQDVEILPFSLVRQSLKMSLCVATWARLREYCRRSVSRHSPFNVPVCRHQGQDTEILPPLSLVRQSLKCPCVSPPGAGCENIAAAQSRDTVPCLSVSPPGTRCGNIAIQSRETVP